MKAGRFVRIVFAAGLLVAGVALSQAQAGEEAGELALRKIMKELGANMQTAVDGISKEDWKLVEKTAPLIADHPQPPIGEKLRIIAFMGSDMGRFKGYDEKVHEAAATLGKAASSGDGEAVIEAFRDIQKACYSCHREFRQGFVKHFYGSR